MRILFCIILLILVVSCDSGSDEEGSSSGSSDRVLVDKTETLEDGDQLTYTLEAGKYTTEITASTNGVSVEWVGGNSDCPDSDYIKAYKQTCTLVIKGQLIIVNETTFGLGPSERVTIKITK